jgi:hypothetical protein
MRATYSVPETLAAELRDLGGPTVLASTVSMAIASIVEGTSAERMSMMQLALPMMAERHSGVDVELDPVLLEQFNALCTSKRLRADVLLTGALVQQLRNIDLPAPTAIKGCHPDVVNEK